MLTLARPEFLGASIKRQHILFHSRSSSISNVLTGSALIGYTDLSYEPSDAALSRKCKPPRHTSAKTRPRGGNPAIDALYNIISCNGLEHTSLKQRSKSIQMSTFPTHVKISDGTKRNVLTPTCYRTINQRSGDRAVPNQSRRLRPRRRPAEGHHRPKPVAGLGVVRRAIGTRRDRFGPGPARGTEPPTGRKRRPIAGDHSNGTRRKIALRTFSDPLGG